MVFHPRRFGPVTRNVPMAKTTSENNGIAIADEAVVNQIYHFREQKVMLDRDLAELYHVETKQLKRQVRRNIERFPEDFMFELSSEEYRILRSQFGTLKQGEHSKYPPMAFTEQGVAMLSSVLSSAKPSLLISRSCASLPRYVKC